MKHRRHTPEQIIRKLREADRLLAEGHQVPEVAKQPEVSEATYHRARAQPRPPTGGARLQGHPRTRCLTNTHRPARPGSAALRRVLPPVCSPSISGWRGRIIPVRQYAHRHSRPGPPPGKWCTRSHQLITMLGLPMLPSDRLLLTWRSSRPGRARAGLAPPPRHRSRTHPVAAQPLPDDAIYRQLRRMRGSGETTAVSALLRLPRARPKPGLARLDQPAADRAGPPWSARPGSGGAERPRRWLSMVRARRPASVSST
jgi:hypothetical protein